MSQRTAKFVSAIFAGLLAATAFATVSHSAPAEADNCHAKPNGAPSAGGHWYYRTDRATKRRCWYVGDAKEKVARAASEKPAPASNPASPPDSVNTQPSIANARAEFPLPQARVEPDTSVFTGQRAAAAVTGTITPENHQRANAGDAGAHGSVVASRWPELASLDTPASSGPSTDNAASAPENSVATPTLSEAAPTDSRAAPAASKTAAAASNAAPPAAVATLPLAAADASSTGKPSGSVQMLLITIFGALALAGLLASAIFRFSGQRRNGRRNIRADGRVNWDSVRRDRPPQSDDARASGSMRKHGLLPRGSLPRELRAADDSDERIAQMLSRLPRRAAN